MKNGDNMSESTQELKLKSYNLSVDEVKKVYGTSIENGLTEDEAKKRIEKYGYNELLAEDQIPRWKVFLNQFKDVLIYILIISALVSAVMEFFAYQKTHPGTELTMEAFGYDWIVIGVIVIINAIIGFVQEGKSDAAIAALRQISAPEAHVIRDGKEKKILSKDLVPGDIVLIHEGDKIPADGRIFEQSNLKAQEAALTGESVAVSKRSDVIEDQDCALADQKNMVFSSTLATFGRGKAIVVRTGMDTEVGKIASLISETEEKMTPLQKKLEELGAWLGKIILVICAIVSLIYIGWAIYRGNLQTEWSDAIISGIALAVAAIPEGLPAVVTTCLAIGVTRMSKRNAIVKKLHSVESLGCTTIICSDKTGTLTKNEMTVRSIWAGGKIYDVSGSGYEPEGEFHLEDKKIDVTAIPDAELTLRIGSLCNNARIVKDEKWKCYGDPTEGCLITSAWKAGMDNEKMNKKYPRLEELPFDSTRKRMSTVHKIDGKEVAYIKGATEIMLDLCKNIQMDGKVRAITDADKKEIIDAYEEKANEALRGLGFAYREAEGVTHEVEELEKDMTFVGMQFMIDPPRDEAKDAIIECKGAGIGVKMITGDNLITGTAIATELGIIEKGATTHEGKELEKMDDDEILSCNVFARVSPEHKQIIVKSLQRKDQVVAMTGDGVNDAPALKNSDVGIAMGITGTDVSKEAAAMVLADDNFATIVSAVEEGRGIYDNIKKFLIFLLSSNIMEVLVLLIAALIGIPAPLVATQLLWVNLITDGIPAVALGFDPYDSTLMKRKPRPTDEPIINKDFQIFMIYLGVVLSVLVLGIYLLYYDQGPLAIKSIAEIPPDHIELMRKFEINWDTMDAETQRRIYSMWHARSITFLAMLFGEMANAYNCRSIQTSLFKLKAFNNKLLNRAVLLSSALTIILFVWQPLGSIFYVIPIEPIEWLWLIPYIVLTLVAIELLKYFRHN